MKITKAQLEEMISKEIRSLLKEEATMNAQDTSAIEAQLEDATKLLELIAERIMGFSEDITKAAEPMPKVIEALEKIDGYLSKFSKVSASHLQETAKKRAKRK